MGAHELPEIEIGKDVAVEHQEALLQRSLVEGQVERTACAEWFVLGDVGDARATLASIAESGLQLLGAKTGGDDHVVDTMGREPIDHEAQEGPVHELDRRLGHRESQRTQASSLAPRENERLHQRGEASADSAGGVAPA